MLGVAYGMRHYTYKLTFVPDPRYYYYGVHKTRGCPESDRYFGSGNAIKEYRLLYGDGCFSKEVVAEYGSRQEALRAEEELVGTLWKDDPFCLNRMPGGAFKERFDVAGLITVHRGGHWKHISKEALPDFEKAGWKKGIPEKRVQELRNYVTVTDGVLERRVFSEEAKRLVEEQGWRYGRKDSTLQYVRSYVNICSGSYEKRIPDTDLQYYLHRGWERGVSREHVERAANWHRGTKIMYSGSKQKAVQPGDIESCLTEGWQYGFIPGLRKSWSEEMRVKFRRDQKGRIWINNGTKCKHIWPEDKAKYLSEGWAIGRIKGQAPNTSGYVRVFKDSERKAIPVRELQNYLEQGWLRGRGW